MIGPLVAIAICVLMEGLFSGSEIGFYSVNRLRLRSRVAAGLRDALVLQRLLDQPGVTMMTTLIGTNVMVYAATALCTEMLGARRHAEVWATLIMTPIIFVVGEMIPKDVFRRRADAVMYRLAGPVDAFRFLMRPATWLLTELTAAVTGGLSRRRRAVPLSRAAVAEWIAESRHEGVLSDYQHALSANVMSLLNKSVRPAMIPLEKVEMIRSDLRGEALRDALRKAGHSRVLVYSGSRKNVLGILHAFDYIRAAKDGPAAEDLVRPAMRIRPRDGVNETLVALQRERQQMALAVNRNGRPVGIVTVKDLVEEIVGELQDL
jgi:CBS domain containing-hemolysin-like protein